jgi:hypothetical protein
MKLHGICCNCKMHVAVMASPITLTRGRHVIKDGKGWFIVFINWSLNTSPSFFRKHFLEIVSMNHSGSKQGITFDHPIYLWPLTMQS